MPGNYLFWMKFTPVVRSRKACIVFDKVFVSSFTDLENVWWEKAPCAIIPVDKPRWEMKIILFGLPPKNVTIVCTKSSESLILEYCFAVTLKVSVLFEINFEKSVKYLIVTIWKCQHLLIWTLLLYSISFIAYLNNSTSTQGYYCL